MGIGRAEKASAGGVERQSEPEGLEGFVGGPDEVSMRTKVIQIPFRWAMGLWKGWKKPPR